VKTGLVIFAFGSPGDIESNSMLKAIARDLLEQNPDISRVYTQLALGLTGDDLRGSLNFAKRHKGFNGRRLALSIMRQSSIDNHPPTLRIADWAVRQALNNNLDRLLVLAAGPHLPRCWRDVKYAAKKLGSQINITGVEEVKEVPAEMWYSIISEQPRTRSPFQWWSREWILLAMPMCLYAKVAG